MSESPTVAEGIPLATREQWLAEVRRVLLPRDPEGGDDAFAEAFDRRLVTRTEDGIEIRPLYTAADAPALDALPGQAPFLRSAHAAPRPWEIRQRVAPGAAGAAVAELESGATGLLVELPGSDDAGAALASALDGVLLDLAPVSLATEPGDAGLAGARALLGLWEERGIAAEDRRGTLGIDPLGAWLRTGGATDLAAGLAEAATLVAEAGAAAPRARVVVADGSLWHDAGATDAQELAWTLAAAVFAVRDLVERGIPLERACAALEIRLAATADQFLTIAKIRAARVLWARIGEAAGLPASLRTVPIHAETSRTMLTRYDTWVNALRSTVACFAAGIGGADAVTVLPHDLLVADGGTPLGRRLARNTQSILQMESHLAQVADAAGGSWYVEALTQDLAAAAWALLGDTERAGGIVAAVEAGGIHDALGKARVRRSAQVATRRRPLTGLSEFPDIDETPPAPLAPRDACGAAFAPLVPHRLSEGFEEQRGRADARARDGQRPVAFLATLGTPAEFTPRATYAKNLFEAGGIRTVAGPVEDFPASGAAIACLCSADAVYRESAAEAATRLRDLGAVRVYLAGRGLDVPGVDEEIGLGCDVLDVLTRALDTVGVPR